MKYFMKYTMSKMKLSGKMPCKTETEKQEYI